MGTTHVALSRAAINGKTGIATEHPLASLASAEALRAGGNAFDAAVAASFSLAVVQHHLGGLGGDFFALFYEADSGKVLCLNSSGWSPSGMSVDLLAGRGLRSIPTFGPFSTAIPGLVRGIHELHRKFGRLEFGRLLAKPIEFAEEGFPLANGLRNSLRVDLEHLPESARRVFAPHGHPPESGELIRQANLAQVLRGVAENGADFFYEDWVAECICDQLSQSGVPVTTKDFADFKPEWTTPLSMDYRGSTVYEVPPNSMGATTLLILKYLQQVDPEKSKPNSPERVELALRGAVAAYRQRDSMLGDPRFVRFDPEKFFEVGKELDRRPTLEEYATGPADTTYYAIADEEGNILSAIQSLFSHFGSRVFVEKAGIFLNNRSAAFKTKGPNRLEPRKRPLHTLSALLLGPDERPNTALGCSGGELKPQQHALFVTDLLDYSMSLEETIDYPRFLWRGGRAVTVESGYHLPRDTTFDFKSVSFPGATGVAQGVQVLPEGRKAVCDIRGDGVPVGS
jgi:gamma-glutamyltranspeptidase/glutathione hydrolase